MADDPLVIRQLKAGRDFALGDGIATQMANFVYLIGSSRSRECYLVDPAWDVSGLVDLAEREGFRVAGSIVTHYHPDHVGGDLWGTPVEGVQEYLARVGAPVWVQNSEADGVIEVTGAGESDLVRAEPGQTIELDGVKIELLHTPGHTPGSQCAWVNERALIAGDTLFVGGCGRTDLPGGDADELFRTFNERLAKLPGDAILYPGHDYGEVPSRSLAEERKTNGALIAPTLEVWHRLFGR